MKQEELFKIIGIIAVSFLIIYFSTKIIQNQTGFIEGMKKMGKKINKDNEAKVERLSKSSESSDSLDLSDESTDVDTIESQAASIKSQLIKLQDELMFSKYKQNYEDMIIDLDDLTSCEMIKTISSMKGVKAFEYLNKLKEVKDSLNVAMTFLDKQ